VSIHLVALDGVHVRAEPVPATLVRLSPRRAGLRVSAGQLAIPVLAPVRLTFDGVDGSDTYAKVVEVSDELLVHFTSIRRPRRPSWLGCSASEGGPAVARILIVEDNEMNRDMLSRRLVKKGYVVTMATDGLMGIEMAGARSRISS